LNGSGEPTRRDLAAIAEAHHIVQWESIVEEVLEAVATWPVVALANQVSKDSIQRIDKALREIRPRLLN
jgi:hypothetical protein